MPFVVAHDAFVTRRGQTRRPVPPLIQSSSMRRSAFILAMACAATLAAAPLDKKDVEYARPGGQPLLLDLHVPDGPGPFAAAIPSGDREPFLPALHGPGGRGPFAAAILIHGGGFDEGSKSTNVRPLFEPLTNASFAWFSIDYRLAPAVHFPEAIEDVNSAIRWVKTHAAEYRVDVSRIAIVGESAGGFFVNYAGTHETPATKVAAVVDFYGPSDYAKLALARRDHPERFNMATIRRHAANGGGIHFFGVEEQIG